MNSGGALSRLSVARPGSIGDPSQNRIKAKAATTHLMIGQTRCFTGAFNEPSDGWLRRKLHMELTSVEINIVPFMMTSLPDRNS
jgi:hypothetical protein